jgi:hypothetical protein
MSRRATNSRIGEKKIPHREADAGFVHGGDRMAPSESTALMNASRRIIMIEADSDDLAVPTLTRTRLPAPLPSWALVVWSRPVVVAPKRADRLSHGPKWV